MSAESEKIERLVTLAERLIAAFEADIAALKAGKPNTLRSLEPEVQKWTAMYAAEARGFAPESARKAPAPLRARFTDITARFREVLALHARLVTRVKSASEGMIKAIAEEVDRRAATTRTYNPQAANYGKPAQAMVFNSVV